MRQVARSRRAATGFCPGGPTAHLRKRIFINLWLRPARRGYVQATGSPGIRSVFDLLRHTPIASTSRTGSRSVPLEPALALHRQAPPSTHAAIHALVWHAQKLHVRAISGLGLGLDSASLKPSTMQLRGPGCTCLHHPDARRLRGRSITGGHAAGPHQHQLSSSTSDTRADPRWIPAGAHDGHRRSRGLAKGLHAAAPTS